MKLTYVAYLIEDESGAYSVEVPDLPGCVSFGENIADAIDMGIDAASGWVLDELEDGKEIPPATSMNDSPERNDTIKTILVLDMDSYAEKYGDKAVRKNLTIPAWLNTFAEKNHINFSEVLQNSLIDIYLHNAG